MTGETNRTVYADRIRLPALPRWAVAAAQRAKVAAKVDPELDLPTVMMVAAILVGVMIAVGIIAFALTLGSGPQATAGLSHPRIEHTTGSQL